MSLQRRIFLSLFIISGLVSCTHDPLPPRDFQTDGPCDSNVAYFNNEVLPLLNSTCATTGCHDIETAEEGVILTNYNDIINTGEVIPFKPEESELYEVLVTNESDEKMPPPGNKQLTQSQIDLIYNWIKQGASDNACDQVCDTSAVSFSNGIMPIVELSCLGCHSGANPSGDLLLTNYEEIKFIAETGILMSSVSQDGQAVAMPLNLPPLPDCQIDMFALWIAAGTPDN
jgi:uncharacterized membrane protein